VGSALAAAEAGRLALAPGVTVAGPMEGAASDGVTAGDEQAVMSPTARTTAASGRPPRWWPDLNACCRYGPG
jgi:hypothetical protein